ncbi:hypothetical protein F2P81_007575 [Scophthalmus maximus]|uniref:Uncharacterized protein n=1 Tax=Scophthalmus maximus TaxID=52904 RepID=A0A6A4T5T2_SCOMX|nr:hypothetical protein F2P81_007575 [Scophthalmus maximus]
MPGERIAEEHDRHSTDDRGQQVTVPQPGTPSGCRDIPECSNTTNMHRQSEELCQAVRNCVTFHFENILHLIEVFNCKNPGGAGHCTALQLAKKIHNSSSPVVIGQLFDSSTSCGASDI